MQREINEKRQQLMAKEAALRSVEFSFTHVRLELNSGLGRWKLGLATLGIPASKFLLLDFLRSIFLKNGFLGMDRATIFEYIHTYTLAQYVKIRRVGSIFWFTKSGQFHTCSFT